MRTIVEPKEHIDKLWGKQRIREEATYRMMRYVLRVDHDGKVLLHNVVTGRLVVLEQGEAETLEKLPLAYDPVLEQLVAEHYLVPEDYDEHQQVVNLRNILWKMLDAHSSKEIIYYTILPTTACNARCWYCFEQGIQPITMTEKTADGVVDFIARSCGDKPVKIRWFGGEPTLAAHRIDQISQGLRDNGVAYTSIITSNGYLFDERMVEKAKNLWNTTQATFSIDGTEETYNRVKVFPGAKDNPYQRMMRNVGLLLSYEINTAIRMNFDQSTWQEFSILLKETQERFHNNRRLMVYPHQINIDLPIEERLIREAWFNQKNEELDTIAYQEGNYHIDDKRTLPSLLYMMCEAGNNGMITIKPNGQLVRCPERLDENEECGSIWQGIIDRKRYDTWRHFADYERCRDCELFPYCAKMQKCPSNGRCSGKVGILKRAERLAKRCYTVRKEQ